MRKIKTRDGMTRAEYEVRAAERRSSAQRLRSQGLTVQEIADRLGVSDERVRQLLSEAKLSIDDAQLRSIDLRQQPVYPQRDDGEREVSGVLFIALSMKAAEQAMKAIILVWIALLVVIVLNVYLDALPSPHPNW